MTNYLVRSKRVLCDSNSKPLPKDILIRGSFIEKVSSYGTLNDRNVVDLGNDLVMPGIVETHLHVNEPGRTHWEGFETASRAAAAGGITSIIDMPLNSIPATTTLSALEEKARAAQAVSSVHYGFWGGVVPANADRPDVLRSMIEAGVMGFKSFLIDSGVDEFPKVDRSHLEKAMPVLAEAGVPLLVHAELCSQEETRSPSSTSYRDYLNSRPDSWEVEAISMMIDLCRETGCPVHIVHLSSADALPIIRAAKNEGLPLTIETCPHYLHFVAEEIPDGATEFKCAPPIRERKNREALWDGLRTGVIDMVVSDHSPCSPELKEKEAGDFFKAWGGISGLQWGLSNLWTEASERGFSEVDLVRWMCEAPACLAGIEDRKGRIAPGFDADLVAWNSEAEYEIGGSEIHHRHPVTPYCTKEGSRVRGQVTQSWVGGEVVFNGGKFGKASPSRIIRSFSRRKESRLKESSSLMDFAREDTGAKVIEANDEFFAEKENLIKRSQPVFFPEKYTDRGKWMDGWETRRKRNEKEVPDYAVIQLGQRTEISEIEVDTAFFLGNYPEFCSVEGRSDSHGEWKELVSKTRLRGGSVHRFGVTKNTCDQVRLRIYPDGGVARLRVRGRACPDWDALKRSNEWVDTANLLHGGEVLECNNMFFSPKENLILPQKARSMAEGWETQRKRGEGHDWVVVRLGSPTRIRRVLVDTAFFKGNYPDSVSLEGMAIDGDQWIPILDQTSTKADCEHLFEKELKNGDQAIEKVRLNVFPDGGVSRLRVWGVIQ